MTITLTREEAQQVLEHLDDLVEAQQWEIDMHITQYGEEYKPHRVKHMRERLASTNGTIEILRTKLTQLERKWQGLTDEEIDKALWENESNYLPDIIRIAEAKLKEKNS
jgi:polyhydroxyalkanoate synthesis regulator phasin